MQVALFIRKKLSEQRHIILQLVDGWRRKLKSDPVTFFDEYSIDCVRFSEAAFPFFFVVAMLAFSMIPGEYLLDIRR